MSRLPAVLLLGFLLASACSPAPPVSDVDPPGTTEVRLPPRVSKRFARVVCSLPTPQVRRIWAGYHPERSGEIQIVPVEFNYFGARSHSGPWPFLQEVPLLFYGPGHVPANGAVERHATVADVAPTVGRHVGFDFQAPDGKVLEEAVGDAARPPRVVVVVIWDGGGRNVLAEYPRAWPNLRELIDGGTWFEGATVASSPSVTPAVHTTIGTGAFPRRHGIIDLRFQKDGELLGSRGAGPENMLSPAMAELYDRDRGNRPVIGIIGSTGILGLIGRGSRFEGGDRDIAVAQTKDQWFVGDTHAGAYRFPSYVNQVGDLDEALRRLDLSDGQADGAWMGVPMPEDRSETPVFAEYQTSIVEEVIAREGFGADEVPDVLFVNYKQIDKAGHRWSMNSPQMPPMVRVSDDALGDLVGILDREVGRGRWVLALTADHGTMPDQSASGGFGMSIGDLEADVNAEFDTDDDGRSPVRSTRVTQLWMDVEELADNGFTLEDVSDFLMAYTKGDNKPDTPPESRDERLFEAAFPSVVLEGALPCLPQPGSG